MYYEVLKLNEIFKNINLLINARINVIVKITNTELSICEEGESLKVLQVLVTDETGSINTILKNELIQLAIIGNDVIIRNAYVEVFNGFIFLVCDDCSQIYEKNGILSDLKFENLQLNFSKVKLILLDSNMI